MRQFGNTAQDYGLVLNWLSQYASLANVIIWFSVHRKILKIVFPVQDWDHTKGTLRLESASQLCSLEVNCSPLRPQLPHLYNVSMVFNVCWGPSALVYCVTQWSSQRMLYLMNISLFSLPSITVAGPEDRVSNSRFSAYHCITEWVSTVKSLSP